MFQVTDDTARDEHGDRGLPDAFGSGRNRAPGLIVGWRVGGEEKQGRSLGQRLSLG